MRGMNASSLSRLLPMLLLCGCDDSSSAPPSGKAPEEAQEMAATPEETPATAPAEAPAEPAAPTEAPSEQPLPPELQELARAGEQGDAAALCRLGLAYETGRGTAADAAKAVDCYRRAAEGGCREAHFNLARCYALGTGVELDPAAFIEHCRQAAEADCAERLTHSADHAEAVNAFLEKRRPVFQGK